MEISVADLRALLHRENYVHFHYNLPWSSDRAYQEMIRFSVVREVPALVLRFERVRDGKIEEAAELTLDEIFGLLPRLHAVLDRVEETEHAHETDQ